MAKPKTIGSGEIHTAIERLAAGISGRHKEGGKLLFLGIANGGVELARRLSARVAALNPDLATRAGTLDISFYRDDISRHPIPKEHLPTLIPVDVRGATIILVDDVLHTGRTLKAALDEIFDHGRPSTVELAILIDRGGRRLPFAPDYCGLTFAAPDGGKVVVRLDADPANDTVTIKPPAGIITS